MRTFKYLAGAAVGLTMVVSGSAWAAEDIATTAHNLSNGSEGICVYCHVPHNGDVTGTAPLWNRTNNTTPGAFAMYSSPTIDMIQGSDPGDISLACLSCHDGTTAYNATLSSPQPSASGTMTGLPTAVGEDGLTNDHPISVTYDITADTQFNDISGTVLPLYGPSADQLECATCHNPHEATAKFLRIANVNSSLCVTCHIK